MHQLSHASAIDQHGWKRGRKAATSRRTPNEPHSKIGSAPEKGTTPMLEKYQDLFTKKAFANLATLMPDGSPQVTPVWVDYDGTHILVDTAKGRVKDKNMRANPRVSLAISDPDNPYRYGELRRSEEHTS